MRHAQPVEYVASVGPLAHGDKGIRTEGDLIYVRTKTKLSRVGRPLPAPRDCRGEPKPRRHLLGQTNRQRTTSHVNLR